MDCMLYLVLAVLLANVQYSTQMYFKEFPQGSRLGFQEIGGDGNPWWITDGEYEFLEHNGNKSISIRIAENKFSKKPYKEDKKGGQLYEVLYEPKGQSPATLTCAFKEGVATFFEINEAEKTPGDSQDALLVYTAKEDSHPRKQGTSSKFRLVKTSQLLGQ